MTINEIIGIVPNSAEHGPNVDHLLEFCHWFMVALFVGWSVFFLYTLYRFNQKRNPRANYYGVTSKASVHLEFSVVLIEAVILLGFALPLWGDRVEADRWPDKDQALRIRAIGQQFLWDFHYTGPDGIFGRTDMKLVSGTNAIGLDPNDPAGADDIVSRNELHLVQFRPTVIEVTSKDVIHSLSLHPMRMTQDAIPGSMIPMWFRPVKTGQFEIVCAQLCGSGHYAMKAQMITESVSDFDAWLKGMLDLKRPAAPATASAVSGFQLLAAGSK
jgi:cytochrome c oxidase subunit 2